MNVHTEQKILHTENFIAHLRGKVEIGTLHRIFLSTLQLAIGLKDFIFQSPYSRYPYCEANNVTFLWNVLQ